MNLTSAFKQTPRQYFLPEDMQCYASYDGALPIGFGQTNSQPSTVLQMLEWLAVEPGNNVLDVGSGSGWTSALLSRLVGATGKVTAIEIVPELVTFGQNNCTKLGIHTIEFRHANAVGYKHNAPYDRILVSAGSDRVPPELLNQLAIDGIMVIPIHTDIWEIHKTITGLEKFMHPGYIFVPFIDPGYSPFTSST